MLKAELEAARALARKAGEVILEQYAKEIIAEEKLGVDNFYEPVTEADRMASRIIVDELSEAFPDDAVLSEEEKDDPVLRLTRKRSWIIDPIDGTAGFVQKDGDFAVQIGLTEDGEPIAGIVYLPFYDEMYFAAKDEGSFVEKGRTDDTAPCFKQARARRNEACCHAKSLEQQDGSRDQGIWLSRSLSTRFSGPEDRPHCVSRVRYLHSPQSTHETVGHVRSTGHSGRGGRQADRYLWLANALRHRGPAKPQRHSGQQRCRS
jgi:3'-phosphoadenosine 5'-phosphosulfate (PAPS) 3'-phosphatase